MATDGGELIDLGGKVVAVFEGRTGKVDSVGRFVDRSYTWITSSEHGGSS